MSANDRKIRLTVELDNALYQEFHKRTQANGQTHSGLIRLLVRKFVLGVCTCRKESVRK